MELVLVRHAQPAWSVESIAQVDPGLTETGRRQAELVAHRLRNESFDRIVVSTAQRAQETAMPVRASLSSVRTDDREWLHEIHMPGSWQGSPSDEVNRTLVASRLRTRDEWWEGMPGGETFHDFHARVTIGVNAELAELGVEQDDQGLWQVPRDAPRLLFIAHSGTNSVVLGHLLGLDPEPWEWERFDSGHASITLLRTRPIASGHIFSLLRFSDVSHLPDTLVSH